MNKIFRGTLFGISIGLGAVGSGMAQSPADSETKLEEIVVTAQKRSEDMQKAAVSIDVVQRGEIEKRGITTLDQALKTVPGVRLRDAAQGGASIFIRGVGNNEVDASLNNQPAVAINVDGVANTQQSGVTDSMFDVERVEVLRGPQGTLYGSSAAGGVVNIVLAQPKNEFEVRGRAQIGNYNARQLEGVINVPLGDQLALRLTGSNNKRDGYVNGPDIYRYTCPNGFVPGACVDGPLGPGTQAVPFRGGNFGASDTTTYRAKAKYDPADWLSITGTYEKTKLVNTNGSQITYANLQAGNLYADAPTIGGGSRYEVFSANVVAQLGKFAELTLLPTRRISTTLPTIGPAVFPPAFAEQTQDTYELRLASLPSSKIVWTTGAYVSKASGDFTRTITTASPTIFEGGGYSLLNQNRPFDTWHVFGQVTYPVTDAFRVTAGARYSHSEPGFSYLLYKAHLDGSTLIVDEVTPTVNETIKQNKVTPKIGIEYDLAPESMLYAQISTGYKAGGLTLPDNTGGMGSETINSPSDVHLRPYEPEVTTTLEIGSKNRFLNDTLQVNADVFYSKWDDMQVQAFDFRPGSDTNCIEPNCDYVQSIYNADTSTQYGLEMDVTWLATADDKFGLNVSALHGKYGTLIYRLRGDVTDLTGRTMANSPSLAGSASYEHIFRLANNLTLTPGINEQFTTKYSTSHEAASGQARFAGGVVPGHHTTDISLTLAGEKWSVSAFGRNVWNKVVAQFVGGGGNVSPSDPRIWGVSVVGSY